jgi:soluble lytic murein transglycosylase
MKTFATKFMIFVSILSVAVSSAEAKIAPKKQNSRNPALISVDEVNAEAGAESGLSLSEMQRQIRLQHAHELLGKHYRRSVVRQGEKVTKINKKIYVWTREMLPKKHRSKYQKVAQAIIDESVKNEFDPVFLMSVIQGESSFNPDMLGKLDEIGLMQIRPATAKWISHKYGMKWKGDKSLLDPVQNVKIGAAFLKYLRERFDSHAQLYLAAYNMGQKNVDNALDKNIWPKDYPSHVMKRYVEFYADLDKKS